MRPAGGQWRPGHGSDDGDRVGIVSSSNYVDPDDAVGSFSSSNSVAPDLNGLVDQAKCNSDPSVYAEPVGRALYMTGTYIYAGNRSAEAGHEQNVLEMLVTRAARCYRGLVRRSFKVT